MLVADPYGLKIAEGQTPICGPAANRILNPGHPRRDLRCSVTARYGHTNHLRRLEELTVRHTIHLSFSSSIYKLELRIFNARLSRHELNEFQIDEPLLLQSTDELPLKTRLASLSSSHSASSSWRLLNGSIWSTDKDFSALSRANQARR